jgi:hypothetical protein
MQRIPLRVRLPIFLAFSILTLYAPMMLRLVLRYELGIETGLGLWTEWALYCAVLQVGFWLLLRYQSIKNIAVALIVIALVTLLLGSTVHLFDHALTDLIELLPALGFFTVGIVLVWELVYRLSAGLRLT